VRPPVIMTDSSSDLPLGYIVENKVPFISLTYHFKGKDYPDDFGNTLDYHEFYDAVRAGEMPSTSQVNVQTYVDKFREYAEQGATLIYIGFSSGLSGSLQSAQVAKKTILEEYRQADITVIDSLSASLGQGLLVYYAYELRNKGASKDEIISWVEENKLKVNHWFTVDSLDHLKRGGRISGAAAAVGGLLNIKPVLKVDNEGRLTPVTKVQGRKKSIRMLAEMLEHRIVRPEEQVIAISHGDCPDDAKLLESILKEKFSFRQTIINQIGPVIGSHAGPGTLAVFFMGQNR